MFCVCESLYVCGVHEREVFNFLFVYQYVGCRICQNSMCARMQKQRAYDLQRSFIVSYRARGIQIFVVFQYVMYVGCCICLGSTQLIVSLMYDGIQQFVGQRSYFFVSWLFILVRKERVLAFCKLTFRSFWIFAVFAVLGIYVFISVFVFFCFCLFIL